MQGTPIHPEATNLLGTPFPDTVAVHLPPTPLLVAQVYGSHMFWGITSFEGTTNCGWMAMAGQQLWGKEHHALDQMGCENPCKIRWSVRVGYENPGLAVTHSHTFSWLTTRASGRSLTTTGECQDAPERSLQARPALCCLA